MVQENDKLEPSEQSVARQAQIAAIRTFYRKIGAHRSVLGYPLSDISFAGNAGQQRFAGGEIQFLDFTPKGTHTTAVRVRFVGFHCIQESEFDDLDHPVEPYFIIGVAGSNRSNTVRFGPFENVDTGSDRFEATMLADPFGPNPISITPPILIGVVAVEHDFGTPEEAEEKVRNVFEAIEEKFDQAAATVSGTSAGSHVMPQFARDILTGWVPEGVAALFGLGDDIIGAVPHVMFDFNPGLDQWQSPPGIGLHGKNLYNTAIKIDGGSEGKYELRFNVEIAHINVGIG